MDPSSVSADRDPTRHERMTVERLLKRSAEGGSAAGQPLSRRARQTQRSVEAYLKNGVPPRWMERLVQIDRGTTRARERVERRYLALRDECGADLESFARRWRATASSLSFEDLNDLIREHNDWYPIERDLPMDMRTRDYVRIGGRSYRRPEIGLAWVLDNFPPAPHDATAAEGARWAS